MLQDNTCSSETNYKHCKPQFIYLFIYLSIKTLIETDNFTVGKHLAISAWAVPDLIHPLESSPSRL